MFKESKENIIIPQHASNFKKEISKKKELILEFKSLIPEMETSLYRLHCIFEMAKESKSMKIVQKSYPF